MKRKIIQLAGKTHVISLPSKWIRNFNLKKGDELDLEEIGRNILIKSYRQDKQSKIASVNVTKLNESSLKYCISAMHKLGYDEIILFHENKDLKNVIKEIIPSMLGFTIMEQTDKKIVLKSTSYDSEAEFNSALRRSFLATITFAEKSLDLIEKKNFSELSSLTNLENVNNQLTSFCLRLINSGLQKDKEKNSFFSIIIWNLEKIADDYKSIAINISKNTEDINPDMLGLYKEVNTFFSLYYELLYNFSPERLNTLTEKRQDLNSKFNKVNIKNEYERKMLVKLSIIISKISDLSSSIFAINHEKVTKPEQSRF